MGKGADTKDRILERALELISENGLASTSLSDLLIASGIKKGTLYYHFPSKDNLCLAVLELAQSRFFEKFEAAIACESPRDGIIRFLENSLRGLDARNCTGGCIFGNTALEMSDKSPVYSEFIARFFDRCKERLAIAVAEAQKKGEIRDDIPAEKIAHMLLAALEGAIMLSRAGKNSTPLSNCISTLKIFLIKP